MPADAPPRVIQAQRWHVLRPDFEASSASGTGLTLSSIRLMMRASEPPHEAQGAATGETSPVEPSLVVLQHASAIVLHGHRITLPNFLFVLIYLLAKAATENGRVVTTRTIEKGLWGSGQPKGRVTQVVYDLRARIAAVPGLPNTRDLILNRPGNGYVLTLPGSTIRVEE